MADSLPATGQRTSLAPVWVAAVLLIAPSLEAQLFGNRGIFGREPDPPVGLTEDQIGVPTPKTGRVQAVKGQEVRFEIEATSKAPGAAVEFLIRTMPTAGRIVSLVENPNARNRAIVTYRADPSSSAESDVFGFAVRYRGGRYSSEMRFDIDLIDVKAEIQATPEVDFGEVMIGREEIREVTVRNLGTGDFNRKVYLNPPWRIVEPSGGHLVVPAKQAQVVKVGFRPTLVGDTSYYLSFSRTKSATTELSGTGKPSFSLEQSEAQLEFDPKSRKRTGVVSVLNHGEKPLRLALQGSSRIRAGLPEMFLAPPKEPFPIEVELPATDTAPFDGMLQVSQESGYSVTAQLVSPVVPGELRIDIPDTLASDVINFGRVGAGRSLERGFVIENIGGVAVPLEFHIPDPFRMLSDPGPQLAPGASVSVAIGIYPAASRKGPVDVTMNVLGPDHSLPIRLLANVIPTESGGGAAKDPPQGMLERLGGLRMASGRKPRPVIGNNAPDLPGLPPIGNTPPEKPRELDQPQEGAVLAGIETYPLVSRELNPEIRSPEDLSIVTSTSRSLTIGWTAPPNSELSRFEVELAGLGIREDDGMPVSIWVPHEAVKFERVDRLVKAEIRGLAPASSYHFRVFTVDENGRSSRPSETMEATTELPMDWTWIYVGFGGAFLALLGLGIRKVILARRPEVYQAKFVDA